MEIVFGCLAAYVTATLVLVNVWQELLSREVIARWADEQGYEIMERRRCIFYHGPFWPSSQHESVYRISMRDRQRHIHPGWVRCGMWWGSPSEGVIEAHWDEETP